jgi:hypothetical protein
MGIRTRAPPGQADPGSPRAPMADAAGRTDSGRRDPVPRTEPELRIIRRSRILEARTEVRGRISSGPPVLMPASRQSPSPGAGFPEFPGFLPRVPEKVVGTGTFPKRKGAVPADRRRGRRAGPVLTGSGPADRQEAQAPMRSVSSTRTRQLSQAGPAHAARPGTALSGPKLRPPPRENGAFTAARRKARASLPDPGAAGAAGAARRRGESRGPEGPERIFNPPPPGGGNRTRPPGRESTEETPAARRGIVGPGRQAGMNRGAQAARQEPVGPGRQAGTNPNRPTGRRRIGEPRPPGRDDRTRPPGRERSCPAARPE